MNRLPKWLDCEKYLALGEAARWNGAQAFLHMLGYHSGWMAGLRGIPTEPPNWVKQDVWARTEQSLRGMQMIELERHAGFAAALCVQAERDRAERLKLCAHEWSSADGVKTEACVKCGAVRDKAAP